jgi:uncharacterized Ntn-hydrolase superfamily protein
MRHPEDRRKLIAILASMQPVDASAPWESADLGAVSPAFLAGRRIDGEFLQRLPSLIYHGLQAQPSLSHIFSRSALEEELGISQTRARFLDRPSGQSLAR